MGSIYACLPCAEKRQMFVLQPVPRVHVVHVVNTGSVLYFSSVVALYLCHYILNTLCLRHNR